MRWKDLLWGLAYPVYQVIGTFRHEAGHALAAIAFGGAIEEFVFLPTKGYWGYVRWEGPRNLFTNGAPYLLDLLTFLIFFVICMRLPFRRRWVWLNLVIIGAVSPLINTAYNYRPNPERVNDVDVLLGDGNAIVVHTYFVLTILLYLAGIYILFTRAKIHGHQPSASRAWTAVPSMIGIVLLISTCSSTLLSSVEPKERQVVETPTPASKPSPVVHSVTMTPAMTPEDTYEAIFRQAVSHVAGEYPQRAPIQDLEWEGGFHAGSRDPDTMEGEFAAGDWNFRLFDWDAADPSDAVDVSIRNPVTFFTWTGSATLDQINGQLRAGGLVPEPDSSTGEWITYTNSRYGYRFTYPIEADVIEHGVDWIEDTDIPEGMDAREARRFWIQELGPNLCVQVALDDAFIWFNPPENFAARFIFCQHLGPNAPGWSSPERSEVVTIDGGEYLLQGRELIKIDGGDHDEALSVEISSGMHVQVGVTTDSEEDYERYREDVLPVLLAILETFEPFPRSVN
ncbi:MAG: hypothetical protein P1P76_08840 [Anaerolineales bacterium]|nr:hypothetical protein [Anaerolineales bacterium]